MGAVGITRRWVKNFAELARPLTRLTGDVDWRWTDSEQLSFELIRVKCSTATAVHGFDWSKPAHLYTDASNFALGMVIMQQWADESKPKRSVFVLIVFDSFALSKSERRYSTYNKELHAIVRALRKYGEYFKDPGNPGVVHTDHKPLVFFLESDAHEGIYSRWAFELRQMNITIAYIPGPRNRIADGLSRTLFDAALCDSTELGERVSSALKVNMVETGFGKMARVGLITSSKS